MGRPGPPGRQFLLASPLRWTSLESLLGRWAQTGAPGTGSLTPWLAINFTLCGVRLELALCLSPGPVTD